MTAVIEPSPTADHTPRGGLDRTSVRPPWDRRRKFLTLALVAGMLASWWAWRHIGMTFAGVGSGAGDVVNLFGRMSPPRFNNFGRTIELAVETFFIALLGTTVAAVLSVPVAVFAAANTTTGRWAQGMARAVIAVCRTIPDLVFAFIFVRAVGIGVLPGVMALALHSIGMVGKLFADAIEEIDEGPRDAVRSTGAGRLQDLVTAVLPQVAPAWIGTFLYRLDINLRASVILGFVGGGGIGFALQAVLRGLAYRDAMGIVIVIAALVVVVELFSAAMRGALIGSGSVGVGAPRRRSVGSFVIDVLWRERGGAVRAHRAERGQRFDPDTVRPPWTGERRIRAAYLAVLLVAIAWASVSTDLSPVELVMGIPDIVSVAGRMFPPSLGGLAFTELLEPMLVTVAVALVATVLGTVVAIPIGLLAAYNVAAFRWIATSTRVVLVGWRAVPELILAVIFMAAIGPGPIGGALALALGSIPFLAKLIADSVEEIDPGPREAVSATGATRLQETGTSVLPQVYPALVGHVLYLLDINIRSSTILGIVGGGGIGFLLFNSMRVLAFDVTSSILIMIFVTIYGIERLSGLIRRLLR